MIQKAIHGAWGITNECKTYAKTLLQQQDEAVGLYFQQDGAHPIMLRSCENGWMPTCLVDELAGEDHSGHFVPQI